MTELNELLDPLLGKDEPDTKAIVKLEQELLESGDDLLEQEPEQD